MGQEAGYQDMKVIRHREIKRILQNETDENGGPNAAAYESCVVCRGMTDVPVSTPISERKCYVPGGGQLCRKCCIKLYGTDDLRSLHSAELEQMFLGR